MQKLPVYLYTNLFDVILDLDNNRGIHQIMYQRPLKIQKGVRNSVQVQFKNSDQKRVNILGMSFKINVYDNADQTLVLSKAVNVLDNGTTYALKGLAEVTFNEEDVLNISSKQYNFSITKLEDDGSYSAAYSNVFYDVAGILEVKDEVFPVLRPSLEIKDFQRNFNPDQDKRWWEYDTGNLRVQTSRQLSGALHTAAFYLNKFKGFVIVEGTLENSPGTYAKYATISSKFYSTAFNGVDYINFNGIFTNIRVKYIPATDPSSGLNTNVAYSGTFDKVLIRS